LTKSLDVLGGNGSTDDRLVNDGQTGLLASLDDIGRGGLRFAAFLIGTIDNDASVTRRLDSGHVFGAQLGRHRQRVT